MPPNPNQVAERADVAEWEAKYQAKQRERRQLRQPEAVLQEQEQQGGSIGDEQQPVRASLPAAMQEVVDVPMQKDLISDGQDKPAQQVTEVQQGRAGWARGWYSSLLGTRKVQESLQH